MPSFSNLTLVDGKSTPVSHVFAPLRNPAGSAEWAEPSTDGSLTKRNTLAFTQKLPGKGRSTVSNEVQLVVPYVVTETINGVSRQVVHSNVRAILTVVCDPDVPKQFRTDARTMLCNAGKDASIAVAFDDVVSFT